ncbi:hypothetical protein SAMN02745135_01123 [Caloranaerobacter azorensis DSM 13643]|uniref:Uncharacterized protein n=1 Tax=Caloranaerobacter azorensis DSM 13643 TaxID=1121264 RepID=A0A1M5TTC4_9FIRM|nr:hypothetical protein [Caloranaerobacter azorensis]SHH53974.1 hypothetical protein SAMN02745135_01123 [Caloranaerobacter azorensis DSM 13643]
MENKVYELLEKMYVEMNEKFSNLENEIKTINNRLNNLEEGQKKLEEGQRKLGSDIKELKQGQELIKDHIDQLDSKNANRHIEAFYKLNNIEKDIKFIKHKLHQTEEDVFDIKDYLKIIK